MTVASSGYTVVIMVTVDVLGSGVAYILVAPAEAIVFEVDWIGLEDSVEVCKVEVVDGSTSLEEVLFDELSVLLVVAEAVEAGVVGTARDVDTGGTFTSVEWGWLVG